MTKGEIKQGAGYYPQKERKGEVWDTWPYKNL